MPLAGGILLPLNMIKLVTHLLLEMKISLATIAMSDIFTFHKLLIVEVV